MEERSPGGFGPTKWAQFANSPPAWAPRTSGRRRAAAAPARPAALLPPGARSRPDFPGGGARRGGRGRRRRGAAAFSSLLSPFSGLPPFRRDLGTAGDRSPGGRAGAEGKAAPPPRTNKRHRLQPAPAPQPPPRALLPGRGAHLGRPPSRRGETSRLRYGAWFSRRLGERWRWRRRRWENGGRAPFPSPPLI